MKRKEVIAPGDKNLPEGYADLINALRSEEVHRNLEDEKNSSEFFE